ncbi:MAG: hypothetical protein IPJ65_24395 [Archangiaceae bacterium]|nr:hypothetical protein [Archangiaceae bacterium]
MRYAYAFNLKTGDDLVAALETQGGEGLSMADVEFTDRSGKRTFCHFPTFSDYDPATRTVALQDFSKAPRRVSVEGLRFSEKGDTRPALYYRAHPGMERFLTPEEHPTRESYRPPAKLGWGEDYD